MSPRGFDRHKQSHNSPDVLYAVGVHRRTHTQRSANNSVSGLSWELHEYCKYTDSRRVTGIALYYLHRSAIVRFRIPTNTVASLLILSLGFAMQGASGMSAFVCRCRVQCLPSRRGRGANRQPSMSPVSCRNTRSTSLQTWRTPYRAVRLAKVVAGARTRDTEAQLSILQSRRHCAPRAMAVPQILSCRRLPMSNTGLSLVLW